MGKYAHGEVIDLSWDDGPDWYAVRGHVAPDEYRAAWDRFQGETGWTAEYTDGAPRHAWARFECCGWSEHAQVLALHETQGRGCFPVTVANAADVYALRKRAARQEVPRG